MREEVFDPHLSQRLKEHSHASQLNLPSESDENEKLNTASSLPPTGYYVIIGCGAAAVVNHTTLRQSKKGEERLGKLPVMHIGLEDPWLHYYKHGMGQPPFLLRMPGYREPVALKADTIRSGLSSQEFAESTQTELTSLRKDNEYVYMLEGWVLLIESRKNRKKDLENLLKDLAKEKPKLKRVREKLKKLTEGKLGEILAKDFSKGDPSYRLLVVTPEEKPCFVYAEKIDICTGGGRPRVDAAKEDMDLLDLADTFPWLPPGTWTSEIKNRKVVHGMDGLTRETSWKKGSRVCVYGGGGIGLNQIERAEDDISIFVDWLPRNTLRDTFNLKRNDTVLRHPTKEGGMEPGDNDDCRSGKEVPFFPARWQWRFGEYGTVVGVVAKDDRIEVKVEKTEKKDARVGYYTRSYSNLEKGSFPYPKKYLEWSIELKSWSSEGLMQLAKPELYDLVILCNGLVTTGLGEPESILKDFTISPLVVDGRMVGLASEKEDIRILGAAAAMFPNLKGTEYEEMVTYRKSLPVSAVPPGFILAASNIAYANGFFADAPNKNINTIPQEELEALLSKEKVGGAEVIASCIVNSRREPNNGIDDIEKMIDMIGWLCGELPDDTVHVLRTFKIDYS